MNKKEKIEFLDEIIFKLDELGNDAKKLCDFINLSVKNFYGKKEYIESRNKFLDEHFKDDDDDEYYERRPENACNIQTPLPDEEVNQAFSGFSFGR